MKKIKITLFIVNFVLLGILILPYLFNKKSEENNSILEPKAIDEPTILSSVDEDLYTAYKDYKWSDNEFEEKILNNNGKSYKLIETNIDGFTSYMLVIYDPSHVRLALASGNASNIRKKETLKDILKKNKALAGINGGRFVDNGSNIEEPMGYVIKDGEILWRNGSKKSDLIAFTYDNKLTLINATGEEAIKMGVRDAVEFGPNLIVNGKVNEAARNKTYLASRSVIAQREDGIVLMLATNGGSIGGPKMSSIIDLLQTYGAVNAANLDGGASTQLVVNDKILTSAKNMYGKVTKNGRRVVNGWAFFEN